MPRAEVGTTKHLSNRMKSKGLQRLRWYCTPCNKQCRDENGFKCHVNSESHVRQMQILGEDPKKAINEYSIQFQRAFLQQLRTAHGTKQIHINHFYQEYIADKEHIHMNATRWPSLTEFAKHLGREGLCRVEETEKGLHISWIDNSPEALRRQENLKKRERMDRGDEEREQKLIQEQVDRAHVYAKQDNQCEKIYESKLLQRVEGEKFKLNFNTIASSPKLSLLSRASDEKLSGEDLKSDYLKNESNQSTGVRSQQEKQSNSLVNLKVDPNQVKCKNVFESRRKKALDSRKVNLLQSPKGMSQVERIAKEGRASLERNRMSDTSGYSHLDFKRQRNG